MEDLTPEEKQFLLKVLSQISIPPLSDGAAELLSTIRSIAEKIAPKAEG